MNQRNTNSLFSQNIIKRPSRKTSELVASDENQKTCLKSFCLRSEDKAEHGEIKLPSEHMLKSYPIENAVRWFRIQGKTKEFKFPISAVLPKVQMSRFVPKKELPKDVVVDRLYRQFSKTNLVRELENAGVTIAELHPTEEQYNNLSENTFKHFLPINFFDDTNFDCHSPEAWLKLGHVSDDEEFNIPGKAYLPKNHSLCTSSWQMVAVLDYIQECNLWKVMTLREEEIFEIPKTQVFFQAEDPMRFVKRLKAAVERRNKAELVIKLETIIDCVIINEIKKNQILPLERITKLFELMNCSGKQYSWLHDEVNMVFQRLMVSYEFENFVRHMPREFPIFKVLNFKDVLPKAFHSDHFEMERRYVKAFKYNIAANAATLLKVGLYYNRGGIEAVQNVVKECQHIENMNIFVVNFAKPLPLADFLNSQTQNSRIVSHYLTTFWPTRVASGICIILRPTGKGWLDITLKDWSVYRMCKIMRLISQIKLRMEDALQTLYVHSVNTFINLLTEPCLQFFNLKTDFEWNSGYCKTEFPCQKPLFYLTIGIDDKNNSVSYSTAPENFEHVLSDIFKKSLEKSSAIRCIDSETMSNLCFDPLLYIKTIELIEDLYLEKNDLLKLCYRSAVVPLVAYSKLYECFIPFCVLKLNEYMQEYALAKKPSSQVRADINEHKRMKVELREMLPANITIGPFIINTDTLKQLMIKKHTEIVRLIFEYYIDRLYNVNDVLLDEGTEIYNRISERPFTIEHLYTIRDYAIDVPNLVDKLRLDIQVLLLEYELLDSFLYNLPDAQFAMKWNAYAWPHKITQRLALLRDEQKNDIEEFKRQHFSNCTVFEEQLEQLNDEVQQFTLYFDAQKVIEVAVEAKKTWKNVEEQQRTAAVLKSRQKLFDLDELSVAFLDEIINSFIPYRNLWTAGADIVKLKDATTGNPMISIELDDVETNIKMLRTTLFKSIREFVENPEIQDVAKVFMTNLNHFIPMFNCIKYLQNENWIINHWQELAQRSEMEIKYNNSINFQYLQKKGIDSFYKLVEEISIRATAEVNDLRKAAEEAERKRKEDEIFLLQMKEQRKCRRDIL